MRVCARRLIFTQSYSSSFLGDDLGGCVDADALETVNQIDAVIQRDFVEVDDVLEVPTHDAAAAFGAGEGDVQGVGGPFRRDNTGFQIGVAQADGFDGDADKISPRQVFLIDLAHALRGFGEFIDDDGGDDPLEATGFHLSEKLPARSVDPRIEDAAINGGTLL